MICLTLSSSTLEEAVKESEINRDYVDLLELRLDLLSREERKRASLFPSLVDKPVILTCRRRIDGGKWDESERARREILLKALDGDFKYIDLEEDLKSGIRVEQKAREKRVKIIRSLHIFSDDRKALLPRLKKMSKRGDIVKLALMVKSLEETEALFRLSEKLEGIDRIIIGMGEYGVPTRILYRKMGSYLVFASDNETAPGQISARKLKTLYRADKISDNTKIYGIVGNPVLHSLSPEIHNPAFHEIGLDAVYLPFPSESINSFFHFAQYMKVQGFSVTIPYKSDVLALLGNVSREVKMIGACNTVVKRGELWMGLNTDYHGFLLPIIDDIESNKINNALVIGAGGASKAIVWALRSYGVKVTILNRTLFKAESIAKDSLSEYDTLDNAKKYQGKMDLIVQTTSVGLYPDFDQNPIEGFEFTGHEIAYDIIYKPKMTKFLSTAKEKGCTIHYGIEMLINQGKLQFRAFTGQDYPESLELELD